MEIILQGQDVKDEQHDRWMVGALWKFLKHHNNLYYNGEAEISDEEYDMHFRYLQRLEAMYPDMITPDSPTQTVGAKVNGV